MDLSIYLAVTGAELNAAFHCGKQLAWMSCSFSLSGTGISGLPSALPPDAMLMLTDETPIQGHDPERVAAELAQAASDLGCKRVLLDFQRPKCEEAVPILKAVREKVGCCVGISELYAADFDCPVLVSPPQLWTPLEEHLAPWKGRELWLEAAWEDASVTVTEAGSHYAPSENCSPFPFLDKKTQAAYRIETKQDAVHVYLHRGKNELDGLLCQADRLGVTAAVGLYHQLI